MIDGGWVRPLHAYFSLTHAHVWPLSRIFVLIVPKDPTDVRPTILMVSYFSLFVSGNSF